MGKQNKRHWILAGTMTAAVAVGAWIAFCGYQWSWGPFARLHDIKTAGLPGSDVTESLFTPTKTGNE